MMSFDRLHSWLYDTLCELPAIESVIVAHPGKTRIIGEAQIKTDNSKDLWLQL